MADEIHRMQWTHPRLGRISETICMRHESEVLAALRTLGIGSVGEQDRIGHSCVRCAAHGLPAREWLPACVLTLPALNDEVS